MCRSSPFGRGISNRGSTDELAVSQDFVATFAALLGTELPDGQALDSNNLLPLLLGKDGFPAARLLHASGWRW